MSESLYRQLRADLVAAVQFLADKPEENADSTLHALWHKVAGFAVSAELAQQSTLPELNSEQQLRLHELVKQRSNGTPLSHLTERQRFMGLEMLAGPQALVPRKETELLARAAIEHARELGTSRQSITALDVCTGSGNIAIAIASAIANARVFAADLSEDAVALARRNADHLQQSERIELRTGDLLAPFDTDEFLGKVDLLTCNPPYISSAKVEHLPSEIGAHEPHLAFDGGPFGVAILMRLLQEAPRFLRPGGWLVFEVGLGQGPALIKRLEKNSAFAAVREHKDRAGDIRALSAQCR
jgi:release factor glutamine methyltransferase